MAESVTAGDTWVLTAGRHKGSTVKIVRATATSVFVTEQGGGAKQGNQKVDPGAEHAITREIFLARYRPLATLGTNGKSTLAFRQRSKPKPKPAGGQPDLGLLATPAGELNISVEDITPDRAAAWLANGGANRRLGVRRVDKLALSMQRGEWQLTGEGIKLDAHGRVRDGQHRLAAIVRSGVTIKSLVVRGVDEVAFDVMDSGRSRAMSDALYMHGFQYTTGTASTVRTLLLYERFNSIASNTAESRAYVTTALGMRYLHEHPEIQEGIQLAEFVRRNGLQGGLGLWGFLCTLWWRIDQPTTVEFVHHLETGANLAADSPALQLRNRALKRDLHFALSAENRQVLAIAAFKCWNAYVENQPMARLIVRDSEELPPLASPPKASQN